MSGSGAHSQVLEETQVDRFAPPVAWSRLAIVRTLLVAALLLTTGCRGRPSEDPSLIDGRVWLEKRPERHTDKVHAAIFLTDYNIGLFDERSSYAGRYELFELTREGNTVKGFFPQTDKNWKLTYAVRACDDLPPFDLCLELSSNPWPQSGAPKKFHGFRDADRESRELGVLSSSMRASARALAVAR